MSLTYHCFFAGSSPDLHVLLDRLIDEHLDEVSEDVSEDGYFYFYEIDVDFHLSYNEDNEHEEPDDKKPLLNIYPNVRPETYTFAFGNFETRSSWFIDFNKLRMARADEALTRLLRGLLKQYEGDFVTMFNGDQIVLYRTDGHVYLNQGSGIAQEPLRSLLDLQAYTLNEL